MSNNLPKDAHVKRRHNLPVFAPDTNTAANTGHDPKPQNQVMPIRRMPIQIPEEPAGNSRNRVVICKEEDEDENDTVTPEGGLHVIAVTYKKSSSTITITRARDRNNRARDRSNIEEDSPGDEIKIEHVVDEEIHQCGYGSFKPKSLQKFHNPKFLLMSMCFCSIVQSFVINGLVPISISTLEKRFHFNSTETGLLSSFYDIAVLLVVVPVCYYGNKGHKGTWCAIGMFIMGLGSLLCVVPQFATGPYQTNSSFSAICRSSNETIGETCDQNESSSLRLWLYVLYAGQFLHGIGASPLYTLGVTYIDENVTQKQSPVYLSIFIASGTLGPAMAFVLGGMLLRVYGDIGKIDIESLGLTGPEDPRWYGAWWIGFLVTGIGGLFASVPLFCFGKKLPEQKIKRLQDIDQANQNELPGKKNKNEVLSDSIKHLHKHFLRLLRNPTFLCMVFMEGIDAFLMNGFVTFVPKIMENLYSLSSSKASMITGGITVPFALAGTIVGGAVIKKFDLKCAKILLVSICASILSLAMVFGFMIRCPEAPLAGANVGYLMDKNDTFSISVIHPCNDHCGCTDFYNPVCYKDTETSFYSPCHAGCTVETEMGDNNQKTWSNCTCLEYGNGTFYNETFIQNNSSVLMQGVCSLPCGKMPYFLVLFSLLTFFQFFLGMPVQQTVLRSIKFDQRSLAMAIQWIFIKVLGSIPGPICFGLAIDKTCILWKQGCGQQACLRYDGATMAVVIMGFGIVCKIMSIFCLFLAWKFYKAPLSSSNVSLDDAQNSKPSLQND